MPWLLNLTETYDHNEQEVGVIRKNTYGREYTLIPIAHTTQSAHIELAVTESGEFHSAEIIDKDDASTIIPATVDSASRAGTAVYPYPLHDNIKYAAGDYVKYGGKIGKVDPFESYISQLKSWVDSKHTHPTIQAIYHYVSKGSLIEDLVREKVLFLDEQGKLIERWNKKYENLHGNRPGIFSVVTGKQDSAFIRFRVHSPEKIMEPPWRDLSLFKSFIDYYTEQIGNEDICYVTGEKLPSTDKHSNKLRHAADKAKIISGNDTSGFTFRGRFINSDEVANISYLASQKSHNALRWLIDRQGKIIDGRVFLIWGNNNVDLSDPFTDSETLGNELSTNIILNTEDLFAKEFSKAIDGYKNNLDDDVKINILVIDSATTGRMGILYYRNMDKEFYFEKVKEWHTTCFWRHSYFKDKKRKFYYGAPATRDIAFATYGNHASDKLIKSFMERMLPSILEGRRVPKDIVRNVFYRASNPVAMEKWEWEKTLSIACALINKEERIGVALDKGNKDRSYLFGRMLAVADVLERSAMRGDENRATNAIRYMNSFAKHPARTWAIIQEALQPYQLRLGQRASYFTRILDEIASQMDVDDFNDTPLTGKYLLGLYSQRHELYRKENNDTEKESK